MKKLKIGIVGTNFISDWFSEASRLVDGVELWAVYSRKLDTGKRFADKYGIKKVYDDYDAFLSQSGVDGVYVASPTICHKEHSIRALEQGKAVLCEKMICESLDSFLEAAEFSRKSEVPFVEAMRPVFDPAYDTVRKFMGEIGEIRGASLVYCQYSSRYDKFKAGVVENAFNTEMKNSALADIGIYPLSMAVSLFGEPSDIISRSVFLSNGFEGSGRAFLNYGGFSATVSYSKINDSIAPSVIEGEKGSIFIDVVRSPESVRLVMRDGTERTERFTAKPTNMFYEIAAFRDMVWGVRDYHSYLNHSEAVMRCVDKIYKFSGVSFP